MPQNGTQQAHLSDAASTRNKKVLLALEDALRDLVDVVGHGLGSAGVDGVSHLVFGEWSLARTAAGTIVAVDIVNDDDVGIATSSGQPAR